jgi:hypothetical protein
MVVLVPAQKKTLQVERSKNMINSSHPLGHPVIVCVICFKGKIIVIAKNGARELFASAREAHVSPNLSQIHIPVANQSNAEVIIPSHSFRRAVEGPHDIIIKVRRPHGELSLHGACRKAAKESGWVSTIRE